MQAICYENRVPQTGKTRARLNEGLKNWRRPNAVFPANSIGVGSPPDAGETGLRRVFQDADGLLDTVFSANGPHHLVFANNPRR
jgi:hypothetical protein